MPADAEVDLLEVEIEQLAISLLALQQPMARDLRFIVSAIRIAGDLERVGDHAVNIALSALRMVDVAHRRRAAAGDRGDGAALADGCSATPSTPWSGSTARSVATSASATTRWTNCTNRCSGSS